MKVLSTIYCKLHNHSPASFEYVPDSGPVASVAHFQPDKILTKQIHLNIEEPWSGGDIKSLKTVAGYVKSYSQ